MLIEIVAHTPKWVFAVFVLLMWLGWSQATTRQMKLRRAVLLPLVMVAFAAWGIVAAFPNSVQALLVWAVVGLGMGYLVQTRPLPTGTSFNAATQRLTVPGSWIPMIAILGIFLTKYAVGATLATNPAIANDDQFAIGVSALYGVFSGFFGGNAVRRVRLAQASLNQQKPRPPSGISL